VKYDFEIIAYTLLHGAQLPMDFLCGKRTTAVAQRPGPIDGSEDNPDFRNEASSWTFTPGQPCKYLAAVRSGASLSTSQDCVQARQLLHSEIYLYIDLEIYFSISICG
jgi:hypothetical protein